MNTTKLTFAIAILLSSAFTLPAAAQSVSLSRQGALGGNLQRDTACSGTMAAGHCATAWAYTDPQGRVWTGQRNTAVGPFRGARQSTVTRPNGETVQYGRVWRR